MVDRGLRIGFPRPGTYSLLGAQGTYAVGGQNPSLIFTPSGGGGGVTYDTNMSGSGTFTDGQSVTINLAGGGFGTKPKGAKPWLYLPHGVDLNPDTNFSRGTSANLDTGGGNSFTSGQAPPNGSGSRAILMTDQNNTVGYLFSTPTTESRIMMDRKFGYDVLHDAIDSNLKQIRWRASINSGVPNTYFGTHGASNADPHMDLASDMTSGGVYHVTALTGDNQPGWNSSVYPDSITTNWHTIDAWARSSSGPNVQDGQAVCWINGCRVFFVPESNQSYRPGSGFITNDDAAFVGWNGVYCCQISNNTEPGGGTFYYGPTLVEDSLHLIVISDESVWNDSSYVVSTNRTFQLPTAWSNTSITLTIRKGIHTTLSGKYLWVVKSDGSTAIRVLRFN